MTILGHRPVAGGILNEFPPQLVAAVKEIDSSRQVHRLCPACLDLQPSLDQHKRHAQIVIEPYALLPEQPVDD